MNRGGMNPDDMLDGMIDDSVGDSGNHQRASHRSMSTRQWIALGVLVAVVAASTWVITTGLRDDTGAFQLDPAEGVTEFDHEYVIPAGTSDRIEAGEEVAIVPAELNVEVGESIRIINNDDSDHLVGLFFVGAGQTLTQRFRSPGTLEGECSIHPSGQFSINVVE